MRFRYEDICHPSDQKALNALESVPGFKTVVTQFMKIYSESLIHGLNMATKIKLSETQMPEIYNLLPPICEYFGISIPEFFLEAGRPNAYTMGETNTSITITSGLLKIMNEDEIKCVLAHECGHILCHHVLYSTMASMFKDFTMSCSLGTAFNLTLRPVEIALAYWSRCSEYTADRAAALYMKEPETLTRVMMRLSGLLKGFSYTVSVEEYLKQATEYKDLIKNSGWNRFLQAMEIMNEDHPFSAVRAYEITEWSKSEQFESLLNKKEEIGIKIASKFCGTCGKPLDLSWDFCQGCGEKIKK